MTRPRVILLHGWRVYNASRSIGILAEPLERMGFEAIVPSYGYVITGRGTRRVSEKFGRLLASRLRLGDTLVGHSNGGRIVIDTSYWTDVRRMVLINPALDRDYVPGPGTQGCLVIHSRGDWAGWLAAHVPWSVWGDMGRGGYQPAPGDPWGCDRRITNLEAEGGHSHYRRDPERWAQVIARFARTGQVEAG